MPHNSRDFRIGGFIPPDGSDPCPVLVRTSDTGLPDQVDLTPYCSDVEDQGSVGSCTANAIVGALEYLQIRAGAPVTQLSRLYVYYNARRFSDQLDEDCGATMAHAMASLLGFGACPEPLWPYDRDRWKMRPSEDSYNNAIHFPGLHYANIQKGIDLKYALASGLPIIFGMLVPDHLLMVEGRETGEMRPPSDGNWEAPAGGHAMLIVGYSDAKNAWLVRNSWGAGWGINGHVWIDYEVLHHYGRKDGFWTVGPLDRNKFFHLEGPTTHAVQQQAVARAPSSVSDAISAMRRGLRGELESNLAETRSGLRDRLRGPGAGGGYNTGPGAGGGYNRGPGAGGGYDD